MAKKELTRLNISPKNKFEKDYQNTKDLTAFEKQYLADIKKNINGLMTKCDWKTEDIMLHIQRMIFEMFT